MLWSKTPLTKAKPKHPHQHAHTQTHALPQGLFIHCSSVFHCTPPTLPGQHIPPGPPHTWTSGWARRALEVWGWGQEPSKASGSRQGHQPPSAQGWKLMLSKITPGKLGRRGSWQGLRQFGWIPGGFTHLPPRSSPGYNVRRCQNVLIPSPNFRLNQNLDIRRRTQECDQPGVGTLLPQFSSLLPCMHSKPSNSVVRETLGNCA